MPDRTPPKHFEIEAQQYGDTIFVRLSGEFDLAADEYFHHTVDAGLRTARGIVLDLTGLTFIDSTGLSAVLQVWERAREDGYDLAVVPGSDQVRHTMELTGLESVLPIVTEPPALSTAAVHP
jgi:anti-sigma B factor antagonist